MTGLFEKIWVGALLLLFMVAMLLFVFSLPPMRSKDVVSVISQNAEVPSGTVVKKPADQSPIPDNTQQLHALIEREDVAQLGEFVPKLDARTLDIVHSGMTSVMLAASVGNAEVLALLLDSGADPSKRGSSERTALQYAAEKNRLEAAKLLLANGVDIDGVDDTQLSSLTMAVERGYDEFAYYLLELGADTNVQHVAGFTALIDAAKNGNMDMVKALVARGADPLAALKDGRTAADLAQQLGHFEIAVYLKALESS